MKIGIKYCGGCNSRYDRTKEVEKLKKQFPQHEFTYQVDTAICDICLLVCGCMTACVSPEGLAAKRFEQLCTPAQFTQLAAALKAESDDQRPEKKHLCAGHTASAQKTITEADIQGFAALTGNYGKLHADAAFAAQCGFKRPVVPPSLVESLLSALMETQLPGDGAILMESSARFPEPAYVGDTVTSTAAVLEIGPHDRGYAATLRGVCTNQNGTIFAEGTYCYLLPEALFSCTL